MFYNPPKQIEFPVWWVPVKKKNSLQSIDNILVVDVFFEKKIYCKNQMLSITIIYIYIYHDYHDHIP